MKKQKVVNGSVKSVSDEAFVKKIEQATSFVEFYKLKEDIIKKLRGTQGD